MPKDAKEYFTISAVARRFDIHPQTLRVYEREGLLSPERSEGNTRLYAREDIERLQTILNLTRDMGVNLAGVEVILRLKKQIHDLEQEKEELLRSFREDDHAQKGGKALVRIRSGKPLKKE